nr:MAG TPA: baseplate protein [Caudoviricetes sp.]
MFLLAAGNTYAAGNTGGEKTHKHNLSDNGYATIGNYNTTVVFRSGSNLAKDDTNMVFAWTHNGDMRFTSDNENYNDATYVRLGGETDTTSSMPPYFVVYMWRRVA